MASQNLALTGQLYSWGFCTHGQLGLKEKILGAKEYIDTPTLAGAGSPLEEAELLTAACGHFHTLVVDTQGNVYSFGRNDRGQLGLKFRDEAAEEESAQRPGAVPHRLRALRSTIIIDVACGAFHCLARANDGGLLSWGWNKHGQLGRETAYQCDDTPGLVELLKEGVEIAGESNRLEVQNMAAGFSHSAAVAASGILAVWGSNEKGQLGIGSTMTFGSNLALRRPDVALTPVMVNEIVARKVAAGDNHLLVLTASSTVMAAGDRSYGQLGQTSLVQEAGRFVEISILPTSEDLAGEHISAVAAGGATCAAISSEGQLYTWGGGVWGQLGHGDRSDRQVPGLVKGLPRVCHVDIAQDHMLAICTSLADERQLSKSESTSSLSASRGAFKDPKMAEEESAVTSLWIWGRRKLLPRGVGPQGGDEEALCAPAEVPLDLLGNLGSRLLLQASKEAKPVALRATCGGSHSVVFSCPRESQRLGRHYTAARCPRLSVVLGPGIKGGQVCEPLGFKIISRNEQGRDEKVGGLRYALWAVPVGSAESPASRLLFELHHLTDARNGTYEGAYSLKRPGGYWLHVHLLPEKSEVAAAAVPAASLGEPVGGSPFRITVESAPTWATACKLEVRRGLATDPDSKMRPGVEAAFLAQACSEIVWEVQCFDVFGNASTLRSDRFSAEVIVMDGPEVESSPTAEGSASPSRSSKGPSGQRLPAGTRLPLQVKVSKVGRSSLHWTPSQVGRYELSVSLLPTSGVNGLSRPKQAIAGSPFSVKVIPGVPSAAHSELELGQGSPTLTGWPPRAELEVQLNLKDQAGNQCSSSVDPLSFFVVRVEGVSLGGDIARQAARLLKSEVLQAPGSPGNQLRVRLEASEELVVACEDLSREQQRDCNTVQLFINAKERSSRGQGGKASSGLRGCPRRVCLPLVPDLTLRPSRLCITKEAPANPSTAAPSSSRSLLESLEEQETSAALGSSEPPPGAPEELLPRESDSPPRATPADLLPGTSDFARERDFPARATPEELLPSTLRPAPESDSPARAILAELVSGSSHFARERDSPARATPAELVSGTSHLAHESDFPGHAAPAELLPGTSDPPLGSEVQPVDTSQSPAELLHEAHDSDALQASPEEQLPDAHESDIQALDSPQEGPAHSSREDQLPGAAELDTGTALPGSFCTPPELPSQQEESETKDLPTRAGSSAVISCMPPELPSQQEESETKDLPTPRVQPVPPAANAAGRVEETRTGKAQQAVRVALDFSREPRPLAVEEELGAGAAAELPEEVPWGRLGVDIVETERVEAYPPLPSVLPSPRLRPSVELVPPAREVQAQGLPRLPCLESRPSATSVAPIQTSGLRSQWDPRTSPQSGRLPIATGEGSVPRLAPIQTEVSGRTAMQPKSTTPQGPQLTRQSRLPLLPTVAGLARESREAPLLPIPSPWPQAISSPWPRS